MKQPERISDRPEFSWMLDMVATTVGREKATYISVPITTGPRLVTWFRQLAERSESLPDPRRPEGEERRRLVIDPNLRDARLFAEKIRQITEEPVIDPSMLLDVPGWRQEDYIALWELVIERFASRLVFAEGWAYSYGCTHEFFFALSLNIPTLNADLQPLDRDEGLSQIIQATRELADCGADVSFLLALLCDSGSDAEQISAVGSNLNDISMCQSVSLRPDQMFKDAILDWLAERGNVAQFVSFGVDLRQRYSRLRGFARNHLFSSVEDAVSALFSVSGEGQVNVRTFKPEAPQGNPFRTRLSSVDSACSEIADLAKQGYLCICNELVNEADGGISGVAHGNWLEFAPDIFPRDIETKEVAALPRSLGLKVIERVYGHRPALDYPFKQRVEFTVTVERRGHRRDRTIIWEVFDSPPPANSPQTLWPNPFSRMIGDKVFGLVVADALGFLVPFTAAVPRRIAPFVFGRASGSQEYWLRTCPREPEPGYFTTNRGWIDPFLLIAKEDPNGEWIRSILSQEGVFALFSGKVLTRSDGTPLVEGVQGVGSELMMAQRPPESLPKAVKLRVGQLHKRLADCLGETSFEWADDGHRTWLLQVHLGASSSTDTVIYDGPADTFHRFLAKDGLKDLYHLVQHVKGRKEGILLVGRIGVTSHMGDLLRRERIPSRIVLE